MGIRMRRLAAVAPDIRIQGGTPGLKCPYCGSNVSAEMQFCPSCKQPLKAKKRVSERRPLMQRAFIALMCVFSVLAICLLAYKLTFWITSYRIQRLYTRGEYTPTINTITLDDGRAGRSIVFYGKDGDQIFLPELNRSLSISGGVARISIADADWFTGDVLDVESAAVTLSPVLVSEAGERTQLPQISFDVLVPDSPITVISPAKDRQTVATSLYLLEVQVVPGSTVQVNGEDVTDMVGRDGLLSQNVNVYPIGDNTYTLLVRTPQHHESRRDITIYRQAYDIAFELSTSVKNYSNSKTAPIKGTIDPEAEITVETDYIPESLNIDHATGDFEFIAKLSSFGDNAVRFRITKPGKEDTVINMSIEYRPTLAEYSKTAWKMDYSGLQRLYEQWHGKVFKCVGPIIDTVEINGQSCYIMNVGTDTERQLLILENHSSVTSVSYGRSYTAYADVSGHDLYKSEYYPVLIARYIDLTPEN